MKSDLNLMLSNLRSREPSIAGANDEHVGNYEANVPYFPGDVELPALIRKSILGPNREFRARRAGSPETRIPKASTLLKNRVSIVSNWAGFYRDVRLPASPERSASERNEPALHLPIMEPDGLITSVWNSGIIFRPRGDELGMLMITRRFDSDSLDQRKRAEGPLLPIGARLI